MRTLRRLAFSGFDDPDVLRVVADRAVAASTTDTERYHAENWARPLREGRRIRYATAKIVAISTDPTVDIHLVAQIEEALSSVKETES